jgi:hypothetical protein
MPPKSRSFRARQHKKEGTSIPVNEAELGIETGLSRHAAKKSSHLAARLEPEDRRAQRKSPPGLGRNRPAPPAVREGVEDRLLDRWESSHRRR